MNIYATMLGLVMLTSVSFAQPHLVRGIGLDALVEIGPDNPLHGLDSTVDGFLVWSGMAQKGELLQERASEAYRMQEMGKYQYMSQSLAQVQLMCQGVTDADALGNTDAIMTQMRTKAAVENAGEFDAVQSAISTQLNQGQGGSAGSQSGN